MSEPDVGPAEPCPRCGGPMVSSPSSPDGRMFSCKTCKIHLLDVRPSIRVKRLRPDAILPTKTFATDAAWDIATPDAIAITGGETTQVPTGLAIEPPPGYFFKLETRSSMARNGIAVAGGIIDPGYRGQIIVVLHRPGGTGTVAYSAGSRIAQAVLVPLVPAVVEEVEGLSETSRGSDGFGSSGP